MSVYRWLACGLSRVFVGERVQFSAPNAWIQADQPIFWFHAASAGEWESLVSVARLVMQRTDTNLICSVFSKSGWSALQRFEAEYPGRVCAMMSPREGDWNSSFKVLRPQIMVTAKYEAWPELWASASERKIPIWILGTIPRSSLVWVRRVLRALNIQVPKLRLFFPLERDRAALAKLFPNAELTQLEETRWDQVVHRSKNSPPRCQELLAQVKHLPKPWGVFGSYWKSDLRAVGKILEVFTGTLFIFPHDTSHSDQEWCEEFAPAQKKLGVFQGGRLQFGAENPRIVIVNQVGYLAEFYGHADWAYVGGGFEAGVHSTIEPAIHGLPILCGPKKVDRFPEIEALRQMGQLQVAENEDQAMSWFLKVPRLESGKQLIWKSRCLSRLGASDYVASELERVIQK